MTTRSQYVAGAQVILTIEGQEYAAAVLGRCAGESEYIVIVHASADVALGSLVKSTRVLGTSLIFLAIKLHIVMTTLRRAACAA